MLESEIGLLEEGRRATMTFAAFPGETFTGRVEIGRTEWRYVTTGLENDRVVEIVENAETSMVGAGEIVLVDGHHFLGHDAAVQIAEGDMPVGAGAEPSAGSER